MGIKFSIACVGLSTFNRSFMLGAVFSGLALAGGVGAPAQAKSTKVPLTQNADPVIMTNQPGSALEAEARTLNSDDMAAAARHHETPLLLIGSAPLSDGGKNIALFVQVQAASLCGSAGCSTDVYLKDGKGWTKILDAVSGPISLLPTKHEGLRDILVDTSDRWVWKNGAYQDTLAATDLPGFKTSIKKHQAEMRQERLHTGQ
ncbi:MAG: hypothetical protein ABF611_05020 [Acetobacter orientalis]|uniref:hypothetical protein n=1 Tax=Acetobacter orientalis TaxID=146474 RepID=UPI0039E7AF91